MQVDFGSLWRFIPDPATITLSTPNSRGQVTSTVVVANCLLRQTKQGFGITGTEFNDTFDLVAHLWEDNLQGVIPAVGMILDDGTDAYDIKEVSHDNRRQRYRCMGNRIRR